jgi:hypothetical protein|tara:strand:- start:37 stop:465 length:429 start_codon:yes stop_codon:yes gene_type:complete
MGLFKDCGCGCNGKKQQDKLTISIISALTFFVIANPETFRVVRKFLGSRIASPTGCPTAVGLAVHSVVFMLVVWGMMNIKKDSESPCSKKSRKGSKTVLAPTVPMVDAPTAEPDFSEPQIELTDSGVVLEPQGLESEGTLFK